MDITELKLLAKRPELELNITLKHNENQNYTMHVDGEAVKSTRKKERIFTLNGATEILKKAGIKRFTVEI